MATMATTGTSPPPSVVRLGSNNNSNGDDGNDGDGNSSSGDDGGDGDGNNDGKSNNNGEGDGNNGHDGDGYDGNDDNNGNSNGNDGIKGNLSPSPVVQLGSNGDNDGDRHGRGCTTTMAVTKTTGGRIVSSEINIF